MPTMMNNFIIQNFYRNNELSRSLQSSKNWLKYTNPLHILQNLLSTKLKHFLVKAAKFII